MYSLLQLSLQERECDDHRVILRDVHADMSGYYKCEVTTSEMYETDEKRQYLLVVRKLFHFLDRGRARGH